jgi:hypothetical protein
MGVRETKSLHIYLSTYLTCKLQVSITARDHLLVTFGLLSCLAGSQTPRLSSALALGPKPQRHSPHTSHSSSTTTTTATSPSSTLCQHQHNLWRPCNPHCHLHPPPPPPPPQDPLPNGANVGTGGGTDAVLVDCLPTSTLQAQHGTVSGSARARLRPSA